MSRLKFKGKPSHLCFQRGRSGKVNYCHESISTWKNLLVLICVIAGIGFALPNFYGEDPALMIAKNGLTFSEQEIEEIEKFLSEDSVSFSKIEDKDGEVLIRFNNVEDQIQASDKVKSISWKIFNRSTYICTQCPILHRCIRYEANELRT